MKLIDIPWPDYIKVVSGFIVIVDAIVFISLVTLRAAAHWLRWL